MSWFSRIRTHEGVWLWLYRFTFLLFMVFFLLFCAVMPIDAISKASKSANYALNTFVIVGALVAFGLIATFMATTRIYLIRSSLSDIPKRYVPLDVDDLPHSCISMIEANFERCESIRQRALKAPKVVRHPGLSGPDSDTVPPLLNFDDAVRALGLKLKWDNTNLFIDSFEVPPNLSFREIVAFLEMNRALVNNELCQEYVELYEELRYSGRLITEDKFIRFMELAIDFVKNISQNSNVSQNSGNQRGFSYAASVLSKLNDDAGSMKRRSVNTQAYTNDSESIWTQDLQ